MDEETQSNSRPHPVEFRRSAFVWRIRFRSLWCRTPLQCGDAWAAKSSSRNHKTPTEFRQLHFGRFVLPYQRGECGKENSCGDLAASDLELKWLCPRLPAP